YSSLAYRGDGLSSRHYLIDRTRLPQLRPLKPTARRMYIQALVDGNPPYISPEFLVSFAMDDRGWRRVEMLGEDPGMWSLHPNLRSDLFYERLPQIIGQIETGDIPEGQRGYHDLNESMIDWSSAYKPKWHRLARHAKLLAERPLAALRGE